MLLADYIHYQDLALYGVDVIEHNYGSTKIIRSCLLFLLEQSYNRNILR